MSGLDIAIIVVAAFVILLILSVGRDGHVLIPLTVIGGLLYLYFGVYKQYDMVPVDTHPITVVVEGPLEEA